MEVLVGPGRLAVRGRRRLQLLCFSVSVSTRFFLRRFSAERARTFLERNVSGGFKRSSKAAIWPRADVGRRLFETFMLKLQTAFHHWATQIEFVKLSATDNDLLLEPEEPFK